MAHLAGMILLHCGPPQVCFKLFTNILLNYDTVYNFNTFNMGYIKQYYRTFWVLLKNLSPELFSELLSPGDPVSASVFLFPWVLTLFTQSLSIDLSSYLWDLIFLHDDVQIMRCCLAVCITAYEAKKHENVTDWLRIIRDAGLYIDKEALQKSVLRI